MGPRFERIASSREDNTDLLKLEQVLAKALPRSVHLLTLCRISSQNGFPEDVDTQFFRYTESEDDNEAWWMEDDFNKVFIASIQRPNFHTKKGIILFPALNPTPTMINAFDQLIGWSEPQVFHCTPPQFWPHLETLLTKHKNSRPEEKSSFPGIMHSFLDVEQAKNIQVTNGQSCYIKPLDEGHVDEIVENWKWRAPHSEEIIRKCLKILVNCGLFSENGKEMVSSVLMSPLGLFNVLYTPERHRRRGYGKIVMEWIAKEAATKLGVLPMAEVEIWNMASKQLLEKVGFVEVYKTKWYYFDPPTPVIT